MNSKCVNDPDIMEPCCSKITSCSEEKEMLLSIALNEYEVYCINHVYENMDEEFLFDELYEQSSAMDAFKRIIEADTVTDTRVKKVKIRAFDVLEELSKQYQVHKSGIETFPICYFDIKADLFLDSVFELCLLHAVFSAEEKEIIFPLLLNAIEAVKFNIKSSLKGMRIRLQKRSALQFLMDNFGDFPGETTAFLKVSIQNYFDVLDEAIDKLLGEYDFSIFMYADEEMSLCEKASALPETHVWWKNHITALEDKRKFA